MRYNQNRIYDVMVKYIYHIVFIVFVQASIALYVLYYYIHLEFEFKTSSFLSKTDLL